MSPRRCLALGPPASPPCSTTSDGEPATLMAQEVRFTLGTTSGPKDTNVLAMERWKEAMYEELTP